MAEYQKLVNERQKLASTSRVPAAPKVGRFRLPRFDDSFCSNNSSQKVTFAQNLNNPAASGSLPRLHAQYPKKLVSSISNDIQSKLVQIPPALEDRAVKLLADTQVKTLLMSSHYYEFFAARLLEQLFNLCDRASQAESERDIALEERGKARAHERSMGESYDKLTEQVENIFKARLQAARNLASGPEPLTSSTDGNTIEVEDSDSPPSADSLNKQVKASSKRREDTDEEEEIDEDPIRPGRRRATIGNALKSQPAETELQYWIRARRSCLLDLSAETAIARLVQLSGDGKSQLFPQKRPKQASLLSSKHRVNAVHKQSKVKLARGPVVVTSGMDSQEAGSDTIEVEVPATKIKKGKEKAIEKNVPLVLYSDSESDDSAAFINSAPKQLEKTSTTPDARDKGRAHDFSEEDDSTADEDDGSNYSDDEKGPAAKHQKVNNKGAYIAMSLDHSYRTMPSSAAWISTFVELCRFRPDRGNTFTVAEVYELPPLMAVSEGDMRVAVEEFGRNDKVLNDNRFVMYGSQLMLKTQSGVWKALENVAEYRSHVRAYRTQVQTRVAEGGSQDDVEVSFRCMAYLLRDAKKAKAAFGDVI